MSAISKFNEEQLFDLYARMVVLYEKIEPLHEDESVLAIRKFFTYVIQNMLDITKEQVETKSNLYAGYFVTENFFNVLPHWAIKIIGKPHY